MTGRTRRHRGLFITLEGPEGSGKSTQIRLLAAALKKAGYAVVCTREPGGTKVAEAIRKILLSASSQEPVTAETEALLVLAARSQHVNGFICPALERGTIVLCDRFAESTFAYQGFGRGLSLAWLQAANKVATGGLKSHLTLLLDVPASVGLTRRRGAHGTQNRLDRESVPFHRRVRRGFLRLAAREPHRIKIVDASRSPHEVRAAIEAFVLPWIAKQRRPSRHRK